MSTEGHRYERAACKYCGEQISINAMARHEAKCQNRTPEERETMKYARDWAHKSQPPAVVEPVKKPVRHHQPVTGANGKPLAKPMSVTMLVDEDNLALALGRVVIQKLPELLPQLIPGLSIEAFATKSHRAPKGEE